MEGGGSGGSSCTVVQGFVLQVIFARLSSIVRVASLLLTFAMMPCLFVGVPKRGRAEALGPDANGDTAIGERCRDRTTSKRRDSCASLSSLCATSFAPSTTVVGRSKLTAIWLNPGLRYSNRMWGCASLQAREPLLLNHAHTSNTKEP